MFQCLNHGWSSAKEPCIACHPRPKVTCLAAQFELLQDLYAPMVEQPDGTCRRDPDYGLISQEDFMRLMDFPDVQDGSDSGGSTSSG